MSKIKGRFSKKIDREMRQMELKAKPKYNAHNKIKALREELQKLFPNMHFKFGNLVHSTSGTIEIDVEVYSTNEREEPFVNGIIIGKSGCMFGMKIGDWTKITYDNYMGGGSGIFMQNEVREAIQKIEDKLRKQFEEIDMIREYEYREMCIRYAAKYTFTGEQLYNYCVEKNVWPPDFFKGHTHLSNLQLIRSWVAKNTKTLEEHLKDEGMK